jgi:hypothetical protein
MKYSLTFLLTILIVLSSINSFSQHLEKSNQQQASMELVYSDINKSTLKLTVDQFSLLPVETMYGKEWIVKINDATPILEKGSPDLPKLTTSVIIPEKARMEVKVISSSYKEYTGHTIAPSKGNLYRDIDPSTVPYTYGEVYNENAFYPGKLAELRDPHIVRDFRGQTVIVYPVQYNPVTQTLRVYDEITVEVTMADNNGVNPLHREKELDRLVKEFGKVYDPPIVATSTTSTGVPVLFFQSTNG